jgi:signal transduction histidine kinase
MPAWNAITRPHRLCQRGRRGGVGGGTLGSTTSLWSFDVMLEAFATLVPSLKRLARFVRRCAAMRPRLSVGQWLALLVVVLFVTPLFISNLWGYLQSRGYLIESAFREAANLAALKTTQLDDVMHTLTTEGPSVLAHDRNVVDVARGRGDPAVLGEQLRAAVATASDVEDAQIVSASGVLLASARLDAPASPDLGLGLCLQRGRVGATVIGIQIDNGATALLAARPVVVAETREVVAVLCVRYRASIYTRLLSRIDRGGDVYLLDEHQHVLAASSTEQTRRAGDMAWLPQPPKTSAWTGRARSPHGDEVIVAYSPITKMLWGVVVALPLAATLADLESLKWQALGVFAVLIAVAALAVVVALRTVIQPIRALATTSERIAAGATGATVDPRGPRELAELATTFNRMSVALRESQQGLEDRIAARTRQLRESEQFLELLVNSIDQRVVVTDRELRILKVNAAAERMHERALVGEYCYRVFEGREAPCEGCPVLQTFDTGRPSEAERSQSTVGGREPVQIETYPVRGEGGAVQSVITISRIVSREKQLQAKLAFQEKMAAFGQLAAGVAHELGNPLASIDAQLQRAEGDPARAASSVTIVRREVGRMSRMLRELVDFARRKRDEVRLVSANTVVEDVVRLIEHDSRTRNVVVTRELADGLPGLRIVEDHLAQVVLNLALNALDALAQQGSLAFATSVVDGAVVIRVRDSGGGIPEEVVPRLFEPFFTTKPAGRGTGLGLFVSKRIVDDMGGTLALESTGPTGTTFVIRLPVQVGKEAA